MIPGPLLAVLGATTLKVIDTIARRLHRFKAHTTMSECQRAYGQKTGSGFGPNGDQPPDSKSNSTFNASPPLDDTPGLVPAETKSQNSSTSEWGFWLRIIGIALLLFAAYWKIKHHMYWGQSASEVLPPPAVATGQVASKGTDQSELLNQVKAELSKAGIPDVRADQAAPYIVGRLNSGEPLSPGAAAQASAMGIFPIPFSKTVIDEYSNWVHETTSAGESVN